jgi:hypothetical protein
MLPLLLRWQDERKEGALLFVLLSVCFFCLGVEWGEGEPWGASKGGLDHEDMIRISYVPNRPSRPRSGMN